MTSIRTDAALVRHAAVTVLAEATEQGGFARDPREVARIDAILRLSDFALKHAKQVWIDLSLDDFLLLEAELTKPPT